jgi:hypothetical protein
MALQKPKMSFVNGKLIMQEGRVLGSGTQIITTPFGADYVKSKGLDIFIMNPSDNRLYERIGGSSVRFF